MAEGDVDLAQGIVRNPRISSGSPTVKETRIMTKILAGRFSAGETITDLAEDFNISADSVCDALRFELNTLRW